MFLLRENERGCACGGCDYGHNAKVNALLIAKGGRNREGIGEVITVDQLPSQSEERGY